ncbi:MAG: LysR family transcriptional regulator [Rhodobacteraceae bacterium]|nr:LysR family transcriptional regulator [Paracoccaceae bacterium]
MDWRNVTFDWNRARAFLVTVEEGSLSAAARALGLAQPTLGRQVSALEEELGVALFERVGHGLELTQNGLDLVEHVRAMAEAANNVALTASGKSQDIEGPICITAAEMYAAHMLPELVLELRDIAPGIRVEIFASNEVRDLRRREADIAIRNAQPDQPDLIARKLGEDSAALYATPEVIERLDLTHSVEGLKSADVIGIGDMPDLIRALGEFNLPVTADNIVAMTNNHLVHWQMTRLGMGIGIAPVHLGDSDPAVRRVLPDEMTRPFPVWLVAHRELRSSRRVRLVYDFLAKRVPRLMRAPLRNAVRD